MFLTDSVVEVTAVSHACGSTNAREAPPPPPTHRIVLKVFDRQRYSGVPYFQIFVFLMASDYRIGVLFSFTTKF
jgi:hypothetical protein